MTSITLKCYATALFAVAAAVLTPQITAQSEPCSMSFLMTTLPSIQQACCLANAAPGDFNAGTAACSGGYPTATDQCSKGCKAVMVPFWSKCDKTLIASGMPGLDGMADFDHTCDSVPSCDMNTMMVGVNHIQEVCCAGGSCGGVYPGTDTPCGMSCAVPFETFWTDCGKIVKAMQCLNGEAPLWACKSPCVL